MKYATLIDALKSNEIVQYPLQFAKKHTRNFVKGEFFQKKFRQIFEEADTDKNGVLDKDETYTLVLSFYLLIAQKTMVIARHIPTRNDVVELIKLADITNDGTISYDEFETLCIYLCEGVAVQLVTQLIFTVLISPFLAIGTLTLLKMLFVLRPKLQSLLWVAPQFLLNDKIGVMCLAPLLNFLLLPYVLECVYLFLSSRPKFEMDLSKHQVLPVSPIKSIIGDVDSPSPVSVCPKGPVSQDNYDGHLKKE
mmetsp:Transcript_3040/g.4645  ORF Transcript_3040/g.4645 Transcript_3040/m.4645 type:complete len:251 (+) Transcript_3040:79-831(+)